MFSSKGIREKSLLLPGARSSRAAFARVLTSIRAVTRLAIDNAEVTRIICL